MVKRSFLVLAIVLTALFGTTALAQARGPAGWSGTQYGYGMMGGAGYGTGMMGYGMMGGCWGSGTGYGTGTDYIVAQYQAVVANLEKQLATTTDETVKAALQTRIEWYTIQVDWMTARGPVVVGLTGINWVEDELTLVRFDMDFLGKVTATHSSNKTWVTNRLLYLQQRLTYLESLVPVPSN